MKLTRTHCIRLAFTAALLVTSLFSLTSACQAEDTVFTLPIRANWEFKILGGTDFNPGPETEYIPFGALGSLTFELDASLNDASMPTTVPFVNVTGRLDGIAPSPPNLLPLFISPNPQFFGGELTNIVRDASDEVVSADVSKLEMQWELIALPGSDFAGLRFLTAGSGLDPNSNIPFDANVNGIPFAIGDVLAGPDVGTNVGDEEFELFIDGDPNTIVVIGRLRTLTVVPEPATATLTMLGCMATAGLLRRRQA